MMIEKTFFPTRPRSIVGNINMSGHRCLSDCRFRGREFNPGGWDPAQYHTLVEIDHEIFSTVILLSAESFKLQAKVCA